MRASRSTTHWRLRQPCRAPSGSKPDSVAASSHWCGCVDASRCAASDPRAVRLSRNAATRKGQIGIPCWFLKSGETGGGVELAIELVELTQRNFHDAFRLLDIGYVHDRVHV